MKRGLSFIADLLAIFIFVIVVIAFYVIFKLAGAAAQHRAIAQITTSNEAQFYLISLLKEQVLVREGLTTLGELIGRAVLTQDQQSANDLKGIITGRLSSHYPSTEWRLSIEQWPGVNNDKYCCTISLSDEESVHVQLPLADGNAITLRLRIIQPGNVAAEGYKNIQQLPSKV
ncbi:MAG: hypothetical protein V1725_02910 [archaeon]